MSPIGAIVRKEIRSYFVSPIAYMVISIFLLAMGFVFFLVTLSVSNRSNQMMRMQGTMPELNLNEIIFRATLDTMSVVLLLVVPVLTMRLLAEEKKLKTMELLMTSPVTVTDIILGKYLAAFAVLSGMLALTGIGPLSLTPFAQFRWEPVLIAYLGAGLLGGLFLGVGLLASSFTENQIIAVIIGFGSLLLLRLFAWAGQVLSDSALGTVLSYLSYFNHFDHFLKGLVDVQDLVYFATGITLSLFLTHQVVESQRWNG